MSLTSPRPMAAGEMRAATANRAHSTAAHSAARSSDPEPGSSAWVAATTTIASGRAGSVIASGSRWWTMSTALSATISRPANSTRPTVGNRPPSPSPSEVVNAPAASNGPTGSRAPRRSRRRNSRRPAPAAAPSTRPISTDINNSRPPACPATRPPSHAPPDGAATHPHRGRSDRLSRTLRRLNQRG